MKLALVGAYGAGKTTLSAALSKLTGLPRTHGSPMAVPLGSEGRSIKDCTAAELIQLSIRRYTERILDESRLAGFVSDGSVVHEWIYGKVRIVAGSFPGHDGPLSTWDREAGPYEEVIDQLGLLMKHHAKNTYDAFVHLPIEFGLTEAEPPISEQFRTISDELLLRVTDELGVPLHIVKGSVAERLDQVVALLGLTPLMSVEEALDAH